MDHDQIFARDPAFAQPEGTAGGIVGVKEEVALGNALRAKPREGFVNQGPAKPVPAVLVPDREVVQIAPAAVVSTEYCAGNFIFDLGDNTEPGIPPEIGGDGFTGVGLVEPYAFAGLPKCKHGIVVGGHHGSQQGRSILLFRHGQ